MIRLRFPAAVAFGLAMITGSLVGAKHLRLTDSLPKAGDTVAETPSEVRVWFSENPSLAVSRLGLEGNGGEVTMGAVEATDDPKSFKARVSEALAPGTYTVNWRTAGADGHVQRGEFTFILAAADRD